MPQAQPRAIPKWVEETPAIDYQLAMYTAMGTHETVNLTRREYKWIKRNLARRRGYLPPKSPGPTSEDVGSIFERGRKLAQEA